MSDSKLGQALKQLGQPAKTGPDPFWDSYGLSGNPFPTARMVNPEILYGQESAIRVFSTAVSEVLQTPPSVRTVAIIAGTAGGKTHFLRSCEYEFRLQVVETQKRPFLILDVAAGGVTVADIVRQIFERADDFCRVQEFSDFPSALVSKLSDPEGAPIVEGLTGDIRSAVERLIEASRDGYDPPDMYKTFTFDKFREVFSRWISGGPLSQTEQKYLRVLGRLRTGGLAVRVLHELLDAARRSGLIEGVFLCLDEMETVFRPGVGPGQIQGFLQDLRYLHDEAVRDGRGFSLLLMSASTINGASNLQNESQPLFQRLGYVESRRVLLTSLSGVVQARDFAYEYIGGFNRRWQKENSGKTPKRDPKSLLSESEIEEAYGTAGGRPGVELPPGVLLDVLHHVAEAKAQGVQGPRPGQPSPGQAKRY